MVQIKKICHIHFKKTAHKLLRNAAWRHCIRLHGTIFGVLVRARVIFDVYLYDRVRKRG